MSTTQKIIEIIETNKISTTEVADVLGKKGQLEGVFPLTPGVFKVGEVKLIYAINNSNYEVHQQLADADDLQNKIVFVYNVNCDRAIFGDLVSKYILLYKKAKAIVVNGKLRDAHTLIKERYPIWLEAVSPIGCVNTINGPAILPEMYQSLVDKYDGSIMVCDDSGVVIIPKEEINEIFVPRLRAIEMQEDIWFYCVDTLKMSTFETVCKKKYLEDGIIDEKMKNSLGLLTKK